MQDVTSNLLHAPSAVPIAVEAPEHPGTNNWVSESTSETEPRQTAGPANQSVLLNEQLNLGDSSTKEITAITTDLTRLQEAAAALSSIASHAQTLPKSAVTQQAIHQIEQALAVLRSALGDSLS